MNGKIWLRGLIAAAVSGAAGGFGAVVGSLAAGDGLVHGLKVAVIGALFSGIAGASAYLKKSPIPDVWKGEDRRITATGIR